MLGRDGQPEKETSGQDRLHIRVHIGPQSKNSARRSGRGLDQLRQPGANVDCVRKGSLESSAINSVHRRKLNWQMPRNSHRVHGLNSNSLLHGSHSNPPDRPFLNLTGAARTRSFISVVVIFDTSSTAPSTIAQSVLNAKQLSPRRIWHPRCR